jgi:hypothetical protein
MIVVEKVRILLVRRGNLSEAEFARRLGKTPQNFNRKGVFKRGQRFPGIAPGKPGIVF